MIGQNGDSIHIIPCNVEMSKYTTDRVLPPKTPKIVPIKLYDQHIGMGLESDTCSTASSSLYMRGIRKERENSGISMVKNGVTNFTILLEVPHFNTDELKVRLCGKVIEVEAKHEERADEYGRIGRYFLRKYNLPDDAMPEKITSSLSDAGVLTVDMPKKKHLRRPHVKVVPIVKKQKSVTTTVLATVEPESSIEPESTVEECAMDAESVEAMEKTIHLDQDFHLT